MEHTFPEWVPCPGFVLGARNMGLHQRWPLTLSGKTSHLAQQPEDLAQGNLVG